MGLFAMHKKLLLLLISFNLASSEDSISKFAHDYFKNIHGHINDESFDKAQNLLDIAVNRYWQNENSYERALLNQLHGQFMQFKITMMKQYHGLKNMVEEWLKLALKK